MNCATKAPFLRRMTVAGGEKMIQYACAIANLQFPEDHQDLFLEYGRRNFLLCSVIFRKRKYILCLVKEKKDLLKYEYSQRKFTEAGCVQT